MKTLLEPLDVEIASARSGGAALFSPTGREIWRDLAGGLFVLLIGESIFATWAGRSDDSAEAGRMLNRHP